jgi:hypothetical protein
LSSANQFAFFSVLAKKIALWKKAYKSKLDYSIMIIDSPTKLESFLAFVVLIYFLLRKTSMKYPQTGDRTAAVT